MLKPKSQKRVASKLNAKTIASSMVATAVTSDRGGSDEANAHLKPVTCLRVLELSAIVKWWVAGPCSRMAIVPTDISYQKANLGTD